MTRLPTDSGSRFSGDRRRSLLATLVAVLVVAAAVVLTDPIVPLGLADDWSYVWSAKVLAETGHVVYNGWATAMLGWQLYLGALFIKVFGFSFTVVRIPILLVGLATTAILHRVLVRLGFSPWTAAIISIALTTTPEMLPLMYIFMSDVPGYFCIMVCVYLCLRALQAETDRAAIAWLVAASLSNVGLGTVRQIAWLGALLMVPSAAWCLRRRRGVPVTAALATVASAAMIVCLMHWFSLQPYSLGESLLRGVPRAIRLGPLSLALGGAFLLLPFFAAFLRSVRNRLIPAVTGALTGFLLVRYNAVVATYSAAAITYPWVKTVVVTLLFAAFFCLVADLIQQWKEGRSGEPERPIYDGSRIADRDLWILFGPFVAAYLLLASTRPAPFLRYILPMLFFAAVAMMRLLEKRTGTLQLPPLSKALVVLMLVFSVARSRDMFASRRALATATQELEAAGVPRTEIDSGFEYNAWTQLMQTGYVNDFRLKIPANSYHTPVPPSYPLSCRDFSWGLTPSVVPKYQVASQPEGCFGRTDFSPVPYATVLPPYGRAMYVQRLP